MYTSMPVMEARTHPRVCAVLAQQQQRARALIHRTVVPVHGKWHQHHEHDRDRIARPVRLERGPERKQRVENLVARRTRVIE